ncbi:MAG: hypothetical protein NZM27_00905, partial [Acetobacteraceae bacterium]|nr:hypothetical protein [Acetobacteraceae bacterium]
MFRQVPPEAFRLVTVLVHPFDLLAELHSGRHAPGGAAEEDPALPEDISAFYEALRGRKDWRLRPQSDRLRAAGQAHPEPELLVASDLPGGFARLRARLGLPDAVLPDAPPPAAPIRLPAELRAALRRDFAADLRLLKTLGAEEPVAPEPAAPPRRRPAAAVPPAGPAARPPGVFHSEGVNQNRSTQAEEKVGAQRGQAGADHNRRA